MAAYNIDKSVQSCEVIAACLIRETGTDSFAAMYGVMNVIQNRTCNNPYLFVSVVLKPSQFFL